jgi:hypothetical protein
MHNVPIFLLMVGFIVFVGVFITIPIVFRGKPKTAQGSAAGGTPEADPDSQEPAPGPTHAADSPEIATEVSTFQSSRGPLPARRVTVGGSVDTNFVFPAWAWKTLIIGCLLFLIAFIVIRFWQDPGLILVVIGLAVILSVIALVKKAINKSSMSPLMKAASAGDTKKCADLIHKGVNVNSKSALGDTALIFASRGCHSETVQFLLSKGASVNVHGKDKLTPLISVLDQKHSPNQLSTIRVLIDRSAQIDARDSRSQTALMYAVDYANIEALKYLIEKGADVSAERVIREGDRHVRRSVIGSAPAEPKEIRELLIASGAKETIDENIGPI